MANPVVHFEISGKDGKELQNFYAKLFGWQIQPTPFGDYGLVMNAGGAKNIGGGISSTMEGHTPDVVIYVAVKNLEATLKKAEALGGKTRVPPTVVPEMVTFAVFADPAGNAMGLVQDETQES